MFPYPVFQLSTFNIPLTYPHSLRSLLFFLLSTDSPLVNL